LKNKGQTERRDPNIECSMPVNSRLKYHTGGPGEHLGWYPIGKTIARPLIQSLDHPC
jgi:hypothetical protein